MAKFYCPGKCEKGDISKCGDNDKFDDTTTFTNEPTYPTCPRFVKEKTPVKVEMRQR